MLERRRLVRLESRLPTVFTVDQTTRELRAWTRDLGGAGVRFITEERLEPGTLSAMGLSLPYRDRPISFLAQVVWSRPTYEGRKSDQEPQVEVGVKFVKIAAPDRSAIVQYAKMSGLSDQD